MTFAKLFYKSNSSIRQLYGNVLQGNVESISGNTVVIDTGLRPSFVCSHNELNESGKFSRIVKRKSFKGRLGLRSKGCVAIRGRSFFAQGGQQTPMWTPMGPGRREQSLTSQASLRAYAFDRKMLPSPRGVDRVAPLLVPSAQAPKGHRQTPSGPTSIDLVSAPSPRGFNRGPRTCTLPMSGTTFDAPTTYVGIEESRFNVGTGSSFSYIAPLTLEKVSIRKWVWTDIGALGAQGPRFAQGGQQTTVGSKDRGAKNERDEKNEWNERNERNERRSTEVCEAPFGTKRSINSRNRVKGFILNSVNGGYAVAIAGYIAFLPKSLCLNKKVFLGQWRQFAIVSMNAKIANIVVKELFLPAHYFGIHRRKP